MSEAIAAMHLTPVLFELGARPHPPQALYRSYLEQSDVFIAIYWQSYGWIAPGAGISGIEDEYRLAAGKPRLVYVKAPADAREPRLEEFLDRLRHEGGVSYKTFETAHELEELVSHDLALLMTEQFRSADDARHTLRRTETLPAQSTSFVGRREQLAEVERLLGDSGARLLTLTGPGGIGKTRLAVESAERLRATFADGVVFVALDGLESSELVASTIVTALGIRDVAGDSLTRLLAHLHGRTALLVLDNFEHVIASAPLVAALLEGAPGLSVLVTSRELLRVRGEHELRVPPLPPETDGTMLFAERAAAAGHTFELPAEDVPAVTEICRRLDGVPLAIELAASALRLLSPDQLLDRLRQRFALAGPRDAPARQRTLQAAIAWSYELLDPDERRLFARLGVFSGGFTIEAAEEIAADGEADTLELLSALLDKSIVYRLSTRGETRFAMLRMIREYAVERLAESDELETTQERLAAYYRRLALLAEDGFRSSLQRQWKATLDLEADNVRAVLGWAAERQRADDVSVLLRGVWIWSWLHGNLDEVGGWASRGLACAEESDAVTRGWLLAVRGAVRVIQSEFAAGVEDLTNAEACLAEAGDRRGVATVGLGLSFAAAPLEGEEVAQTRLAQTLAAFEELDDLWGIGTTLHAICRLRTIFGRYDDAGDLFERAVDAVERIGDDFGVALALINLANAHLAADEFADARRLIGRILRHMQSAGITYAGDELCDILARLEHADGENEHAVELVAAAESLRGRFGIALWPPMQERQERFVRELRAAVGDQAFEAAYERGRARDVTEIQEDAMRLVGDAA